MYKLHLTKVQCRDIILKKSRRGKMIVTFCGHSQFFGSHEYENMMFEILEREVGDQPAEMYLGGYGDFDSFAYACCKRYKKSHPKVSLVFVTPYLKVDPMRVCNYDSIFYPELENIPQRFAISYRNKYMVEKADLVIAFINHDWGRAYKTYSYAQNKGKRIINLVELKKE